MQVKDALGAWTNVQLEADEVAVLFGQTATQASAGLFRPATYRVVRPACCLFAVVAATALDKFVSVCSIMK